MGKIFKLINENAEKYYGMQMGAFLRDGYAFTGLLEEEIIDLVTDCNFPYDINLQLRSFETEEEQEAFQKGYMRHFAIVQQNLLDSRKTNDKKEKFRRTNK